MSSGTKMKLSMLGLLALTLGACVANNPNSNKSTVGPSPTPSASPLSASSENSHSAVTLAVLDALLANENFVRGAPEAIVATERSRAVEFERILTELRTQLERVQRLQ